MLEQTRFLLPEEAIPTSWYNLAADLPHPPPPVLHPGTHQPIGPDDLAPLFPMAVIGQEVSTERFIPIPEEVLAVYRLWRPTPLYRAHRLERALDLPEKRAHLLQVRRRQPRRVPQAEHRGAAGVLRQARGREADSDRNGGWAVGQRPGAGRLSVRSRDQGLHGQDLLRAEAVPASADGDLGRAVRRLAQHGHQRRPHDPRPGPRLERLPGDRYLGSCRGRRHARGHEVRPRDRCSITCFCTRP